MSLSECTVSGAAISVLNGGVYKEIPKTEEMISKAQSSYVRKASNKDVPAKVDIFWPDPTRNNTWVEITTSDALWTLYYKTEPIENTTMKTKTVTFVCGTKFTTTDPFNTIRVSHCPIGEGGLNGTYTKSDAAQDLYTRAATSGNVGSAIKCNWTNKEFSIAVLGDVYKLDKFTHSNNYTVLTSAVESDSISTSGKNLTINLKLIQDCKYANFGNIITKQQTGTTAYTVSCYNGSEPRTGGSEIWSAQCSNGKLAISEPCKPGPTQKYILVTKFTGSLVSFNGSYLYDESTSSWKNTKTVNRIAFSETEPHILELRDSSASVNYCIKITPGPPLSLSCVQNKSNFPSTTEFEAKFSATPAGPDPCEAWSTCIGAAGADPVKCAADASSCSSSLRSASTASTASLIVVVPPSATVVVPLHLLVTGAPHMYGSTADTLFVVVPSTTEANKAKVLHIPTDTTKEKSVKDAVLSASNVWTVVSTGTVTPPAPPTPPTPPTQPSTPAVLACDDLVSCATTATSLTFSSCAAAAVACEPKRPKDLVSTHTLNHGDEKGIKLFPLTGDVLYGTDAVNAYVVVATKEKVLVAPLDNKTDAVVLDAEKEGTVWTSKRDNKMLWIIIGSAIGGGLLLIVGLVLLMRSSRTNRVYAGTGTVYEEPLYAGPRYRRPRIRQVAPDLAPVTSTSTPNPTAPQ